MDYFQRLFNESRPAIVKSRSFPSLDELSTYQDSTWYLHLQKGITCYNGKEFDKAIYHLDSAIVENNTNTHLLRVRAKINEDSGAYSRAIGDYKMALYYSGTDWYGIYNQIAVNYLNLKEFGISINAFDIAIELKLKLVADGFDEEVLPFSNDIAISRIDIEKIYTNRANAKLSVEDFKGCADDCNSAIKENPNYANSYFIFGLLLYTIDQEDKAYKAFKIAESKGHVQASSTIRQLFG